MAAGGQVKAMLDPVYNIENVSFLVVDDNRHMRSMVRSVLGSFGVREVHEATSGKEGLDMLKEFQPDIIIVDWVMHGMDGLKFAKTVRQGEESPNPYVAMIMLTAHTELTKVTKARDAGVNEFMAKPLTAKSLYSRIASIIAHPRPFIESPNYFGPDRRRRQDPRYKGPDRRESGGAWRAMSDEELDKLMESA